MANQFLGLSLFIMLLSFFIILNAISSFEVTKSQPVMNSLTVAFSNREPVKTIAPGQMNQQSQEQQLGSSLDQIEALFKSQITAVESKQNRLGTIMHVRLPFKDFKKAILNSLTVPSDVPSIADADSNKDVLPMLVSLMETQRNTVYKMDMVLNIEQQPAILVSEKPDEFAALNKSITDIADKLEQAGLPKKQVSAGLKGGQPGYVDLMFSRYEPFNPLGVGALPSGEQENP